MTNLLRITSLTLFALLVPYALFAATPPVAAVPAAAPAGKYAKVCTTCHKTVTPGEIRGFWDSAVIKSKLLQVKLDTETEVVYFSPDLQVVNAPQQGDLERQLSSIHKNAEMMVTFELKGGKKMATALIVKPKLKVADHKIIKTDELERLIGYGSLFRYALLDARPKPLFDQGALPTAINLPFPAFEKQKGKLPKDKNTLVVFYCSGAT